MILGADMGGSEYAMYAPGVGLGFGMANMFSMGQDQANVSEDEYKGFWGYCKGGGLVGAMLRKKARERNAQTVGNGNPFTGTEHTNSQCNHIGVRPQQAGVMSRLLKVRE